AFQDTVAANMLENLSLEQRKQFYDLLLQLTKNKAVSDLCEEAK
ncbi:MAG TPA: MarR family transcriptional regulator, partial [Paenibacillus sp.]|nr:MarR family transcriptional regulator [Paenibacillus sp.]